MPGVPERRTHDYVRHGTTNLYAALDVAWGKVIADLTARHRAEDLRWWDLKGPARFPDAQPLLITADAGGSNGYRLRALKVELARLAAETGLSITVCHCPPGTSKWNRVEHLMFSFITTNWRVRPLTTLRTIELISATTTETGLNVQAAYEANWFPTGIKITDAQLTVVLLQPHDFQGEWNYIIAPSVSA